MDQPWGRADRRVTRRFEIAGPLLALLMAAAPVRAQAPQDWQATVAKEIARSEYRFSVRSDGALSAPNRAHGLRSTITASTLELTSRVEGAERFTLTLRLAGYGRGRDISPVGVGTLVQDVHGAAISRSVIREWYVNDDRGLEQGFTLTSPPPGRPMAGARGALEMALGGDVLAYPDAAGRSILFKNAKGQPVVRYGELKVLDANGRTLPAKLLVRPGVVRIEFDDRGAAYPVTVDPLATSPGWTVQGDDANASYGSSVSAAGDVNGDGYGDVIVGATYYDGGQVDEGRAFVYLGSASGLSTTPTRTYGIGQGGAGFGYSVSSAGDVDADGFDDMIVGAWHYDNGNPNEGSAYLYRGAESAPAPSHAWTAEGDWDGAEFGFSVRTAGDVNGDGHADVIIGARLYNNVGRVYLYLGTAGGLEAQPVFTDVADQSGANFGYSVAGAGDVNGDGYADFAVGATGYDNGQSDEGRVYIYHGGQEAPYGPPGIIEINQDGASFGRVSGAGDVNGDGYSDLIVGAHAYDNPEIDEGGAFLYLGSSSGLGSSPVWTGDSDQAGAQYGIGVGTAGDVNGDGRADVVVGAALYSNGEAGEGKAFVYLGAATGGLTAMPTWAVESNEAGANFGEFCSGAGDVDGDGYGDVIVGAQYYGPSQEGGAFLYHGSASGPATSAAWTADSDQMSASFGFSVSSAGDVNGDGYSDVIVGAERFDGGQSDEGRAFVYLGSASGLASTPAWIAESDQIDAYFGHSVARAGDVDGDGHDEVVVGAPGFSNGQTGEGKVFVYMGSPSGPATDPTWMVESDQANANLGKSAASAGDVNGDGYQDLIVGARAYSSGQANEGRAFVYHGSATGLVSNPAWFEDGDVVDAQFGYSVAGAGDVNADGYSDVIVGAETLTDGENYEGKVFVYLGSPTGLEEDSVWTAQGDQADAFFGASVSSAGDVNGDGYSDVIIGAYQFDAGQSNEGRAHVFLGSPAGPTGAPWTVESDQADANLGIAVSTAGDVNADGYSDVIVGAYNYDNVESNEGQVLVFLGSATGLSSSPAVSVESNQAGAFFGYSVSAAGDVNGDGYSDVIVGAIAHDDGESDEGSAFLYYGNGGAGLSRLPRQLRADRSAPIAPLGRSDSDGGFRLSATGRSAAGRDDVRMEWQIKPFGTAFGTTGIQSGPVTDTGAPGVLQESAAGLESLITGLTPATAYIWRLRTVSSNPFFPRSPWFTLASNGPREMDVRTRTAAPPSVVSVFPPANQIGVPATTNVTVAFSETVDASTVTASSFRLLDAQGAPVAATRIVAPSGREITLDPTAPLAADALYTVETTSAITDLVGTAATHFTSSFRTAAAATGSTGIAGVGDETSALPADAKGGSAIAGTGDLDGDDLAEVISGAPGYSDTAHGVPVEAGAAFLHLGSGVSVEASQPDVIFTGETAHDRAGTSVAGDFDFNGDGLRDIVIGAEQVDRATNPGAPAPTGNGKVYVIFFDPGDTAHYPNLGNPALPDTVSLALVGQPGGLPGVVFTGVALGDQAGFSVDCGGTSKAGGGTDIVIGAPGANPGGRTDAGAVYVVFDDPALEGVVSLADISSGLPGEVPGKAYLGESAGDLLGFDTAFAGSIVQGQSESTGSVIMGAPGAADVRGRVFGVPGDPDTTPIIVDAVGSTRPGVVIAGTQTGEALGTAVASGGDALADGIADVLIGSPSYDDGGDADAGRALQISQKLPSGEYTAADVGSSIKGAIWTGDAGGDGLGTAVASVGDVTGDGYDDIALGAPFFDPSGMFGMLADAGAVFLAHGSPGAGFLGTRSVEDIGTVLPGLRFTGSEAGEHAGSSITGTGDVNDDGQDDFAVGAPDRGSDAGTTYTVTETVFVGDADRDAILDGSDNCPTVANPSQTDADQDGIGDHCDGVPGVGSGRIPRIPRKLFAPQ